MLLQRLTPRRQIIAVLAALAAVNLVVWLLTIAAALHYLAFFGIAVTAYVFGLRHSIDADHISAIDNATRRLMHDGQRPIAAGLFFSLGHSTVVFLLAGAIAAGSAAVAHGLLSAGSPLARWGGTFGSAVSALFLLVIAGMNIGVLRSILRMPKHAAGMDASSGGADHDSGNEDRPSGLMTRLFGGLFRTIDRSWKMYPVGLLFGLGFDTASEIGLLVVGSVAATKLALPLSAALLIPLLFTSGMALADTIDGMTMVGAYGSAVGNPDRRRFYNALITCASILSALLIAALELLQIAAARLRLGGAFWASIDRLGSGNASGLLGAAIVIVLLSSWGITLLIDRFLFRRDNPFAEG